jgi:hypothetical protein
MSDATFSRRSFLVGGVGTALGFCLGCGSGSSISLDSLKGYLILQEGVDIVAVRPDGTGRAVLFTNQIFDRVSPGGESFGLRDWTDSVFAGTTIIDSWFYGGYHVHRRGLVGSPEVPNANSRADRVWSPDGEYLLCVAGFSPPILTIARWDGTLVQQLALPTQDQSVFRDGGGWTWDSMGWLDPQTVFWNQDEGTYRLRLSESTPQLLSVRYIGLLSPDGRSLYSSNEGTTLSVLELATGKTQFLPIALGRPVRWSDDGQYLLGTSWPNGFFRLHLATQKREAFRTDYPAYGNPGVWAPDGQRWAYTDYRDNGEMAIRLGSPTGEAIIPGLRRVLFEEDSIEVVAWL